MLLARELVQFLDIRKYGGVYRSTFLKGVPDKVH